MKCEFDLCGNEFEPYRAWQRFCNTKCRDGYWNQINPKRRAAEGTFDPRRCEVCNRVFIPVLVTQKYHHEDCRWIAYNDRKLERNNFKVLVPKYRTAKRKPRTLDRTIVTS